MMVFNNSTLLALSFCILPIAGIAETAYSEVCPISKSSYRDGDDKGFQLIFSSPPVGSAIHATAIIKHSQQGELYRFNVTQSSGYGSIWLFDQNANNSKGNSRFWITFFDQNLKSATPLFLGEETDAPQYAVIAELGSYDYYKRRGNPTPPLLPDVVWIRDRCQ